MSDASAYVGDKLLNWVKGSAMGAAPAAIFASLWNGDPDGAGMEVTGTVNLTAQAVTFGAVASRKTSNSGVVNFGTANGAASVSFVVLADNATYGSGNQISKKHIAAASIANGTPVKILAGNLVLSY